MKEFWKKQWTTMVREFKDNPMPTCGWTLILIFCIYAWYKKPEKLPPVKTFRYEYVVTQRRNDILGNEDTYYCDTVQFNSDSVWMVLHDVRGGYKDTIALDCENITITKEAGEIPE